MIWIDKIIIEGFRGIIKPLTYKFNSEGINLITGPNGSGKSTIVTDALSWVIWKKLVKKGKTSFIPWPNVIDDNYIGTKVELKFHDDRDKYTIIRCSDYKGKVEGKSGKNRFLVFKNGKEVFKSLRDKADYQAYIIKQLGYSFDLFKSTVLFAQELDRLMEESGPSKKMIFDEAFDSVFIGRAREIVEKRYKDLIVDYNTYSNELTNIGIRLDGKRGQIDLVKEMVKNFEKQQEDSVNLKITKIGILETELKKVYHSIKAFKKDTLLFKETIKILKYKESQVDKELSNREFRLDMEIKGLEDKLQNERDRKKGLLTNLMKSGKCPNCGARMDKRKTRFLRETLARSIKECRASITSLSESIEAKNEEYKKVKEDSLKQIKTLKKIESLKKDKIRYERGNNNLKIAKISRNNKRNQIENYQKEIEDLKKQKPPENNLFELLSKKSELQEEYRKVRTFKRGINAKMKIDKWLMDDPLSNSGLKAFIFDSMLKGVNNHLKAYIHLVKFKINIYIDMSQATKPISVSVIKNKIEVPYEDLSKGQKQLVHVAIAFALNDTINDAKPINIMIMDELFESLDPENVEAVWNIILSKTKNKSIHIITHQTQFQPTGAKPIRIVQNTKGQSVIDKG